MDGATVAGLLLGISLIALGAVIVFPYWGILVALISFWTFLGRIGHAGLGRIVVLQHAVLLDQGVRKRFPAISGLVERHARAVGIPVPEIMLLRSRAPSACAWGTGRRTGVGLRVTLAQLPVNRVSAMLAHEVAHLKNRDEAVFNCIVALIDGLIAAVRWSIFGAVIQFGVMALRNRADLPEIGSMIVMALAVLAVLAAISIAVAFWLPRLLQQHEFAADALGSVITGDPVSLVLVLSMLESAEPDDKNEPLQMRTHPPLQARVTALMRLALAMEKTRP